MAGVDLIDRERRSGFISSKCSNFLKRKQSQRGDESADGLIPQFAERALALNVPMVALLVPLGRLPAALWLKQLPVKRILLLTPRPSIPSEEHIAEGGNVGGSTKYFAWL